jgi:hypothetical protein
MATKPTIRIFTSPCWLCSREHEHSALVGTDREVLDILGPLQCEECGAPLRTEDLVTAAQNQEEGE